MVGCAAPDSHACTRSSGTPIFRAAATGDKSIDSRAHCNTEGSTSAGGDAGTRQSCPICWVEAGAYGRVGRQLPADRACGRCQAPGSSTGPAAQCSVCCAAPRRGRARLRSHHPRPGRTVRARPQQLSSAALPLSLDHRGLAELKRIHTAQGSTLNDVVLAAITWAFRDPGHQHACYQQPWRTEIIYRGKVSSPLYSRNRV